MQAAREIGDRVISRQTWRQAHGDMGGTLFPLHHWTEVTEVILGTHGQTAKSRVQPVELATRSYSQQKLKKLIPSCGLKPVYSYTCRLSSL